jgi:hypothetical protein
MPVSGAEPRGDDGPEAIQKAHFHLARAAEIGDESDKTKRTLLLLRLQAKMQDENKQYALVAEIMRKKYESAKGILGKPDDIR